MNKEQFEKILTEVVTPKGYTFEVIKSNCGGYKYKIGMGLSGPQLLNLKTDLFKAIPLYQWVTTRLVRTCFDVEGDFNSDNYGKFYLHIPHVHFEPPPWKENTLTSTSTVPQATSPDDLSKSSDPTASPSTPENGSK